MFSNNDIRGIYDLIPPPTSELKSLSSLLLSASGVGFITLQHIQADFEQHVTKETRRTNVPELARLFDVAPEIIIQLVRSHSHLALLSTDRSNIIPKSERHTIQTKLHEAISSKLISKLDFSKESDIDPESLDALLQVEDELVHYDGHVCNKKYDDDLSSSVQDVIQKVIDDASNKNITPEDASRLPGSPPMWFVLKHFQDLIASKHLEEEVFLRDLPDLIQCQSYKAKDHNVQEWSKPLLSGEDVYLDLEDVARKAPELYLSTKDAQAAFREVEGVEVVEACAISEAWIKEFAQRCMLDLRRDRIVSAEEALSELYEKVPATAYSHVVSNAERLIFSEVEADPDVKGKIVRMEGYILTEEKYEAEKNVLFDLARIAATTKWEAVKGTSSEALKFDIQQDFGIDWNGNSLHKAMLREKPTEKAAEEHFWAALSAQEAQNETDFATFWTERITSRTHMYTSALDAIEDAKLKTQLSELLASYIHKDLLRDTISKARAQGLALSRKTRGNMQKLGTRLETTPTELSALSSALDKFTKKQGIATATAPALDASKQAMLKDMRRRMHKHQKASDGPVLFLTLVIVLFAKHYPGVVYATGKFAPKLVKQLKARLPLEQYERVEKWKEAAKMGTLSAEDREEMRGVAEA